MALSRRTGQRFQASIWPGFVDAMTGLLLVLMFVLTIFMVVQFVLRETITGQESELDALSSEVAALAQALGLERDRTANLETQVGGLRATLDEERNEVARQASLIATLTSDLATREGELDTARTRITSFEAQVATLLSEKSTALGNIADLEAVRDELMSEQEALNLALATARGEIDAQSEVARLAAAKREALEALIADLNQQADDRNAANAELNSRVANLENELSDEERARLAEAAAAEALRARLKDADAELTAMTLALEQQRQRAEDTLTMLAAADAAREDLTSKLAAALLSGETTQSELSNTLASLEKARAELQGTQTDLAVASGDNEQLQAMIEAVEAQLKAATAARIAAEAKIGDEEEVRAALAAALAAKLAAEQDAKDTLSADEERAALLAAANKALTEEEAKSAQSLREVALLNQQVGALRSQLSSLQAILDDSKARDEAAQIQLQSLGSDLNTALARAAVEERKRRELEEAERVRLEAEAKDLQKFRSEFFGRLREVLANQEGVRIVGDRFVFSSEVLFDVGRADLSEQGKEEIAKVAAILQKVSSDIPDSIDWIIRVDGHTDNQAFSSTGKYADNWELSQGRALSVVRHMSNVLDIPPGRLSANGFGEFQPLDPADTPQAHARNRRIEIKLTER